MRTELQQIEIEMIRRDAMFFYSLLNCIAYERQNSVIPFGLVPYLSLFIVESHSYFSAISPDFARDVQRQHESILKASRTRIKLFDDDYKNIPEILNHLSWISEYQVNWFVKSHTGYLAWLKRAIQPDLGLFFYDGHLVGTTHTAFFNLGFERGTTPAPNQRQPLTLSEFSRSVGAEIGQYIGGLSRGLGIDLSNNSERLCQYDLSNGDFTPKDVRSQKYYKSIFNGSSSVQLNSCLILFLTTVNFLNRVFRRLVVNSPETFFKLKFIALYHLISSLKKIQDYYYPQGLLSRPSKAYLAEILADKEIRLIQSDLCFRNALMHYRIEGIGAEKLDMGMKLFGLVSHFFDNRGFEDLNLMIDNQISRVSELLTRWAQRYDLDRVS